jgi:SAM-dependent methyltransferase
MRAVAARYEQSAAGFAAYADRFVYRHLAAPLAEALAHVQGRVLDVATGAGALGRLLPEAVGLDIARDLLDRNPLARLVQGSAQRLPFRADAFAAAASSFGINHCPHPEIAVREMARVAPVVGLLTWARPAAAYRPRELVLGLIERHAGSRRTPEAQIVDRLTDRLGSEDAIGALLRGVGLTAEVRTVLAEVPWPGAAPFVEYRLSLLGATSLLRDVDGFRREAIAALEALPAEAWAWTPRLVLGLGRRPAP